MCNILNIGSLNVDHVYTVDHFVVAGETQSSIDYHIFPGGKGLNQSIALAKAGAHVRHAVTVGEDGMWLEELLRSSGVDTSFVRWTDVPNGKAIIQVDRGGQNCILLYSGSNACLTVEYLRDVMSNCPPDTCVIMQNELNVLPEIIDIAREHGFLTVLNPSPANEKIMECDLSKVDYLIMNETEGAYISGKREVKEMLAWFAEKYPHTKLILTLGTEGSYYQHNGKAVFQKAFRVNAVDTTAAGDTFTGFVITELLAGNDAASAMRIAAAAAAICVTENGAAVSIPSRDRVLRFLEEM